MSLHLSELCCPDKQIGTRKLTLTNGTRGHAVNRHSQAAADGLIAEDGELTEWRAVGPHSSSPAPVFLLRCHTARLRSARSRTQLESDQLTGKQLPASLGGC